MSYLQTALKVVKEDQNKREEPKIRLVSKKTAPIDQEEVIWRNPFPQGTPAARRHSLEELMTEILLSTRERSITNHQMKDNETSERSRNEEKDVDRLREDVIQGTASLADYRMACEKSEISE